MPVLSTRCWGLDVHQQSVVACRLITSPTGRVAKQVRTFSTMTTGVEGGESGDHGKEM